MGDRPPWTQNILLSTNCKALKKLTTTRANKINQSDRTYRSQVQIVEHFHAILPRIRVAILLHALFIESIDLCDLARLMISSQKGDTIWVPCLQAKQQLERFDTIVSSINEIAHKDIICTGGLSADFEQLEEIKKLPVNVTAYLQNVNTKINAMALR